MDADKIIQVSRNTSPEATDEEKAKTMIWLQKARGGYDPARIPIYFDRGSFRDELPLKLVEPMWAAIEPVVKD